MVLLQTPDYALQRVFKATFGLITVSPHSWPLVAAQPLNHQINSYINGKPDRKPLQTVEPVTT